LPSDTIRRIEVYLRFAGYSEELLVPWRNSIDLGSPLPNEGEGPGVRGRAHV
jgi:hypothetical protein